MKTYILWCTFWAVFHMILITHCFSLQVGAMLINRVANTDLSWHKEWTAPRVSPHFDLTLDEKSVLRAIDQLNFIQMKRKQILLLYAPISLLQLTVADRDGVFLLFRPVIKLGGLKETPTARIHFNFRFNWLGPGGNYVFRFFCDTGATPVISTFLWWFEGINFPLLSKYMPTYLYFDKIISKMTLLVFVTVQRTKTEKNGSRQVKDKKAWLYIRAWVLCSCAFIWTLRYLSWRWRHELFHLYLGRNVLFTI